MTTGIPGDRTPEAGDRAGNQHLGSPEETSTHLSLFTSLHTARHQDEKHQDPRVSHTRRAPRSDPETISNRAASLGTAAVIPALNEAAQIASVVAATSRYVDQIFVIDDGSSDRTAEVATEAGAEVIRLLKNQGKAGAVQTGVEAARRRGYSLVVLLDADGQHLPAEIPRVIGPVLEEGADLVIGSRFLSPCAEVPAYRRMGQRIFDLLTGLGSGVHLTDSQSGFRALGPRALEHFDFDSNGYGLESEMITHLSGLGLAIREVPITCRYDVPNSHKKHPFLHGLEIVGAVTHSMINRQHRALRVIGMPLVVTGSVLGIAPVIVQPSGSGAWTPGSVLFFGLLLLIGIMLVAVSPQPPRRQRDGTPYQTEAPVHPPHERSIVVHSGGLE